MKKIKCMAVFAMLVVMAVFSSCGAKAMSISEAVDAINKLKSGESITIVLNNDTTEITEELTEALQDDSHKVNLDLSKTKIKEIGESAFYDCTSLTSVTIPNSVTEIGDGAFWGCESLTNVNIADSVTSIGFRAFQHCRLLANVTIPDSVTSIGKSAFKGCGLTSIEIPKSVEKIGDDAFKDCASLKSVSLLNFSDGTSRTAFDDNVRVTFANGTQYTWGEFWTYIEYLEYLSLFY